MQKQTWWHSGFVKKFQNHKNDDNKTIKDGDISPRQLDHSCPYGHREWLDQMEWREHNLSLDQLYGEDGRLAF